MPTPLERVFTDTLRWQLERILIDRTASGDDPKRHAQVNRAHAEMWRILPASLRYAEQLTRNGKADRLGFG